MRAAAHAQALSDVFSGKANHVTAGALNASIVGITAGILKEYQRVLGGNLMYLAWFASAQASNRFATYSAAFAPQAVSALTGILNDYGTAGYFSANNIFVGSSGFSSAEEATLTALGLNLIDVAGGLNQIPGDSPDHVLLLRNKGEISFDVLDQYIAIEDRIVIYDKYIGDAGLELIEYISRKLRAGSSLEIFTTTLGKHKCKTPLQIEAAAKLANPAISVLCKEVSVNFRKDTHDRYLFCGTRLQIVFSAGIDSFGLKVQGKRKNKESTITFYGIRGNDSLEIEDLSGAKHVVKSIGRL